MKIEDLKVGDIVIRGSSSDNPVVNYGLVAEIKFLPDWRNHRTGETIRRGKIKIHNLSNKSMGKGSWWSRIHSIRIYPEYALPKEMREKSKKWKEKLQIEVIAYDGDIFENIRGLIDDGRYTKFQIEMIAMELLRRENEHIFDYIDSHMEE